MVNDLIALRNLFLFLKCVKTRSKLEIGEFIRTFNTNKRMRNNTKEDCMNLFFGK